MKYMDIDCYERGCACASSSRVAGEDTEVVEVVRLRELSKEEIKAVSKECISYLPSIQGLFSNIHELDIYKFANAVIKKASEK
jgi:hypothetical protein